MLVGGNNRHPGLLNHCNTFLRRLGLMPLAYILLLLMQVLSDLAPNILPHHVRHEHRSALSQRHHPAAIFHILTLVDITFIGFNLLRLDLNGGASRVGRTKKFL